jgi:predicted DsbA family dithiol-disulfide isomerase
MTRILISIFFVIFTASCQGQTLNPMPSETKNPLLCDVKTGVCEMPGHSHVPVTGRKADAQVIRMIYFTDPICSACWSIEPQLRKLLLEYGSQLQVEYHMGGLLPSWEGFNGGGISKPSDVAHHWDEMSAHFGMPIDGNVWLEDPLPSSYPPCIAFKSAEMQDKEKSKLFLRRIKEMVFVEKKYIARWQNLQEAAEYCGLDTAQLRVDFNGPARQLFQSDLELARQFGVRGFPAIYFFGKDNKSKQVYGFAPYENFEQAVMELDPEAVKNPIDSEIAGLFGVHSSYTLKEYSTLAGINGVEAEKQLTEAVTAGWLEKVGSRNGNLWRLKSKK